MAARAAPSRLAIAFLVGGHSTAKAAVEAGVDRKEIVKVAMEDGDVMAWLLATIPEYAKEKRWGAWRLASLPPLSRLSRVCVRLSLPQRGACATHAIRVFCVCCRVQYGRLPLHRGRGRTTSQRR